MQIAKSSLCLLVVLVIFFLVGPKNSEAAALPRLQVSENKRFLIKADGTPFFWMGDTAWSLPTVTPEDVDLYLNDRAQKGFNVIQVDADSYGAPNYAGLRPFKNENPGASTNPSDWVNEAWWQYLDSIVVKAEGAGIYVCLMNMWGAVLDTNRDFWGGYLRFNLDTQKAYRFGLWIGNRYKNNTNIIWSLAGEYAAVNRYNEPVTSAQRILFNQVAKGISDAGGTQLMTIHSGAEFNTETWHDLTLIQTGHNPDNTIIGRPETYEYIKTVYESTPTKPVVDAEMVYEAYPNITPAVVRRKTYWSVFAGGFGVTYGHVCIETMNNPYGTVAKIPPICDNNGWRNTLDAGGGSQMQYLRALMESVPDPLNRIPDQAIITSGLGSGTTHVQATRDAGGKYALVYIPDGHNVTVQMAKVSGTSADASWYNPRTGESTVIGNFPNNVPMIFDAPGAPAAGNDWVLVLKKQGAAEKIIQLGDSWKYKEGTATPAAAWTGISFEDASWSQGPTMIGRGDEAYATTISGATLVTLYARKNFTLDNVANITGLKLILGYDDGFVAYLNGQEVARANMPTGVPNHTTVTANGVTHEVVDTQVYDLSSKINTLQNGNNVLAVEVHNKSASTGDIGINPELEVASTTNPADVNGDGNVNIKDIQACIKVITNSQTDTDIIAKCKALAAPDATTNIKDIQVIIREIIK